MSLTAQILRLCAVSIFGAVVLGLWRGLPTAPPPEPQVAACGITGPEAELIRWVSQAEARVLMGDHAVTFVDCRPREHFVTGHVTGSVNVPGEAEIGVKALAVVRGARTVITYCDGDSQCERSLRVASVFMAEGMGDVRVLEGGMPAWLDNGYPAESGTCRLCPVAN